MTLSPGMVVHVGVKTAAARPIGTWTSWGHRAAGLDWEDHDEQAVCEEVDD